MKVVRTVEPSVEPVSDTEMEQQLTISTGWDNVKVLRNIKAARQILELDTDRSLITQTLLMTLDKFPTNETIHLPKGIVQSVTSIKYYDTNGDLQTLAPSAYSLKKNGDEARIDPIGSWVSISSSLKNAVEVTYVTGYGDAATDVPEWAKEAIIVKATELYTIGAVKTSSMYDALIRLKKVFFDYAIND